MSSSGGLDSAASHRRGSTASTGTTSDCNPSLSLVHTNGMKENILAQQQHSLVQQLCLSASFPALLGKGTCPLRQTLYLNCSNLSKNQNSSRQQLESKGCQRGCSTEHCSWFTEAISSSKLLLFKETNVLPLRDHGPGRRDE